MTDDQTYKNQFGERLKAVVKKSGFKIMPFAEKAGISKSSFSYTLSGSTSPSVKFLHQIHTAFPHINLDYLITGRGDMILQGEEETKGLSQIVNEPSANYGKSADEVIKAKDALIKSLEKQITQLEEMNSILKSKG